MSEATKPPTEPLHASKWKQIRAACTPLREYPRVCIYPWCQCERRAALESQLQGEAA